MSFFCLLLLLLLGVITENTKNSQMYYSTYLTSMVIVMYTLNTVWVLLMRFFNMYFSISLTKLMRCYYLHSTNEENYCKLLSKRPVKWKTSVYRFYALVDKLSIVCVLQHTMHTEWYALKYCVLMFCFCSPLITYNEISLYR